MEQASRRHIIVSALSVLAVAGFPSATAAESGKIVENPKQWADDLVALFGSRDVDKFLEMAIAYAYSTDGTERLKALEPEIRKVFQITGTLRRAEFITEKPIGSFIRVFWHVVAFERAILYTRTEIVNLDKGWQFHTFFSHNNPAYVQLPT